MEISAIGMGTPSSRASSGRGLSALKSEDFFKLLVTEMRNQDPLQPSKTEDVIGQVSQIRTIEQSTKLTDTLDQMTQQQRIGGASALIGKYVQAIQTGPDGAQSLHAGVVTGVRFVSGGGVVLELDNGDAVAARDVVRVSNLADPALMSTVEDDAADDTDKGDGSQKSRRPATGHRGGGWLGLRGWLHL